MVPSCQVSKRIPAATSAIAAGALATSTNHTQTRRVAVATMAAMSVVPRASAAPAHMSENAAAGGQQILPPRVQRSVALNSVGVERAKQHPLLHQPEAGIEQAPPVEQEEQPVLEDSPQIDADMHANDSDENQSMHDGDEEDADMLAAAGDAVPPPQSVGKQRRGHGRRGTQPARKRTRSAPATAAHDQTVSSDELSLPSESRCPESTKQCPEPTGKMSVRAGAEKQPASEVATGPASASRRGTSLPSGRTRTRSGGPAEVEADGTSPLRGEDSALQHMKAETGKAKGSGQQARNKRRTTTGVLIATRRSKPLACQPRLLTAYISQNMVLPFSATLEFLARVVTGLVSTGAEPVPEATARKNGSNEEDAENFSSETHVKCASRKVHRRLQLLGASEELIVSSKRNRVPPAAFSMNQMGGQNDPLPPSHEERVRMHEGLPANLLLPSESEDDLPPNKRRKSGGGTAALGRSKSVGAAVDRGKKQRRGGSAGASIGRSRKTKGEDRHDDLYGDVDMVSIQMPMPAALPQRNSVPFAICCAF